MGLPTHLKTENLNQSSSFQWLKRHIQLLTFPIHTCPDTWHQIRNILTTRERLHICGKAPSPACLFYDVQVDTVDHVLACHQSTEVATPFLASLSSQVDYQWHHASQHQDHRIQWTSCCLAFVCLLDLYLGAENVWEASQGCTFMFHKMETLYSTK